MRKKLENRIEELERNLKNAEEQIRILEFRQRAGNHSFILTKNRWFIYIEAVRDGKLVKERVCLLDSETTAILINDKYLEIHESTPATGEKSLIAVYEIYTDGNFQKLPLELYKEAKYPHNIKLEVTEIKVKIK